MEWTPLNFPVDDEPLPVGMLARRQDVERILGGWCRARCRGDYTLKVELRFGITHVTACFEDSRDAANLKLLWPALI